ncbi:MAG: ABC transporter permease [Alphaproteobacteria bacterium]|nr:ABC transporter permease [Alphaproteobacteria bacterium]
MPASGRWGKVAFALLVGAILLFLIAPVVIVVPMSFSDTRFMSFPPERWSLRWYRAYLESAAWMDATRVSLSVAFLTTLVATPVGVAAAYAINASTLRAVRAFQLVLLAPLMVPIIIVAAGIFFVYAKIGLITTIAGLVLAHVMLALPYVLVATLAGLRSFDMTQEMVARSLGMNRMRSFLAVTLPQIRPSVVTGALFAFIASLDETVVALFISGGDNQTLTKRMFTALRDEIDPTIAAISSLLIATSFLLVLLTGSAGRRAR